MFEIEVCNRKKGSHRGTAIVEQPLWNGILSEIDLPKRSIYSINVTKRSDIMDSH